MNNTIVSEKIVFEQPLNERVRTFLRLEFLFRQLKYMQNGQTQWEYRVAIATLIEILNIINRGDFKSETIKELERQESTLNRLQQTPAVDHSLLNSIVSNLKGLTDHLYAITGQIGYEVREDELIKTIMQRSSIPGGTCDFDIPAYHHWLQQPIDLRRTQLNKWCDSLEIVQLSVGFLLNLLRESTTPQPEEAMAGNFQKKLSSDNPVQLIRVIAPKDIPFYAEISGGKHRFTVRFMEPSSTTRPRQTEQDVAFHLACCII